MGEAGGWKGGFSSGQRLFAHQLYEYQKGVRRLVLHTGPMGEESLQRVRLEREAVPYLFVPMAKNYLLFFGDQLCIDVVRSFGEKPLRDFSVMEDFCLGVMLGYDLPQMCRRLLKSTQVLAQG